MNNYVYSGNIEKEIEEVNLTDYIPITSRGDYKFCLCPRCGVKTENKYHTPCIYIPCPVCKYPMIGDLT